MINNATKPLLSVEIKSVALKDLDGNWVYYHGVVNTEDDLVSKDHGSRFSTSELKFFAEIGVKIIEVIVKYTCHNCFQSLKFKKLKGQVSVFS